VTAFDPKRTFGLERARRYKLPSSIAPFLRSERLNTRERAGNGIGLGADAGGGVGGALPLRSGRCRLDARFATGDTSAFEQLYRRHRAPLYRVAIAR
jgi:hypothetical protein